MSGFQLLSRGVLFVRGPRRPYQMMGYTPPYPAYNGHGFYFCCY